MEAPKAKGKSKGRGRGKVGTDKADDTEEAGKDEEDLAVDEGEQPEEDRSSASQAS